MRQYTMKYSLILLLSLTLLIVYGSDTMETTTSSKSLSENTNIVTISPPTINIEPNLSTSSIIDTQNERISFVTVAPFGLESIHTVNIDGSNIITIASDTLNFFDPYWSPSGEKILFQSARPESPVAEDIWVANADGTGQTRLTNDAAYNGLPSWSPDGGQFAFTSKKDGYFEIYTLNFHNDKVTRLTDDPAFDFYPAWSPNDEKIAFISDRDGNQELYMMNHDGSDVTQLTSKDSEVTNPSWLGNDEKISFVAENSIWFIDINTNIEQKISTDIVVHFRHYFWSPKEGFIIFTGMALDDSHLNVYLIDITKGDVVRLTDDMYDYFAGPWSPSGHNFAIFRDSNRGLFDLYVMGVETYNMTHLANNLPASCCVSWQPSP